MVVMPIIRRAAKAVVVDGWRAGNSGAFIHTPSGHWGQVAFRIEVARDTHLHLSAGALSPYLMRVINHLDPGRYPPPSFMAAHAQTEWFQNIAYDPDHLGPAVAVDPRVADPTADYVGPMAPSVILGPMCTEEWAEQRIRYLIRKTTPLLSDSGLRDWMLEIRFPERSEWPGGIRRNLRYAIVLTRHLHLDEEIPPLLAADTDEFERSRASRPVDPSIQRRFDRKKHFNSMWSPERFVRWLENLDPD